VLEVTERQPLENLTETRRVIAAQQGLGVRVAKDDVGTGHSGLS
jgi:EAL domain-containing protein (putative c-di-GMP-specific phosphodiesterase class I)